MDKFVCKAGDRYLSKHEIANSKFDTVIARVNTYLRYPTIDSDGPSGGRYCITANIDGGVVLTIEKDIYEYNDEEFLLMMALYELLYNIHAKKFYIFVDEKDLMDRLMSILQNPEDFDIEPEEDEFDVIGKFTELFAEIIPKNKIDVKFINFHNLHVKSISVEHN